MPSATLAQPLSHGALIKAVRSLDQSSSVSIPETLANLWLLLAKSTAGPFYASEELILRWLLKNMNGMAGNAEQFRRYPLAWNIMESVFRRMPLFSLAKSLADRRFIPVLQQTLKDISKPQNETTRVAGPSSDVEMGDAGSDTPRTKSRKRKRSSANEFDLDELRKSQGCLKTAGSVFETLRILLARFELVEAESHSNTKMGAEHVKSLFCSSAKDTMEILRPMLAICDLALADDETEPRENQSSWIATFASLWDFHLQSSGDALEVAMSLYPTGCIILTKTQRLHNLVIDPQVKATWTRDLRRFFINNMILPARAAFLNRKDIGMLTGAVEVTSLIPTISTPILFSLAVKASHLTDDASAKKDHEDWIQKVFETLEEPLREAETTRRNNAMKIVLNIALENKVSLSLSSLRTICRQYTTESGKLDLKLVSRIANLDIDVFLISDEGHKLLDDILHQITDLNDTEFEALGDVDLTDFVVSLTEGFARGRDLSGFLKKWFEALAGCLAKDKDHTLMQGIWSSQGVSKTVSGLIQSSMNTKQLLAVLEWLESQEHSSKVGALLVVLDAISQGIAQEEFVDAVNTKLFDIVSTVRLRALDAPGKALWWRITGTTVSWSTSEQSDIIWTKVESDLKKTLKKADLAESATLAAFHCCCGLWLAHYPGGQHESESSAMACAFLKRLGKEVRKSPAEGDLQESEYFKSPRLIDLVVKQSGAVSDYLRPLLVHIDKTDGMSSTVRSVLFYEANLHSHKYLKGLIQYALDILARAQEKMAGGTSEAVAGAVQVLLNMPLEAFSREQREHTMKSALSLLPTFVPQEQSQQAVVATKRLLSLMIYIMGRPTFYEEMKFADLVEAAESLTANIKASIDGTTNSGVANTYEIMGLFESLATATVKQMTLNIDKRERAYLEEAATTVLSWSTKSNMDQVPRYVLSKILASSLELAQGKSPSQPIPDPTKIKEHLSLMVATCLKSKCVLHICHDPKWLRLGLSTCFTLTFFDQLAFVEPGIVRDRLLPFRKDLENLTEALCSKGLRAGWRLKGLLFCCFGEEMKAPLNFTVDSVMNGSKAEFSSSALSFLADIKDISEYIDIVIGAMGQEERVSYFKGLSRGLRENQNLVGSLFIIRRLVLNENNLTGLSCANDQFDLAALHSSLASQLSRSKSTDEFVLIAQILHTLLDKKASFMKQWNTEVTLSTVAAICAKGCAAEVRSSPKTYEWLCRLVEVIIKRHRLRLEGHFHLLVVVLQSLLRLLLAHPSQQRMPSSRREKQAKKYSRLLTLVCEPSVASVTRSQPNGLDSATDAAKRSAGQHMYLIVMLYIRLQLENGVPRGVKEALEVGIYSILDITTQEVLRIVNEAMDGSGRAIFKELYKQYKKFGKWSGV